LKAARKQQYIMFLAPIVFLNDELKAELGTKTKKDDEEDDKKFHFLKVSIYPTDKDSQTYIVKIHKYDTGNPEEFLKWGRTLTEQIKANGYEGEYDMVMDLDQAMLHGRGLNAKEELKWSRTRPVQPRIRMN
jgi:hypothetical protein